MLPSIPPVQVGIWAVALTDNTPEGSVMVTFKSVAQAFASVTLNVYAPAFMLVARFPTRVGSPLKGYPCVVKV